VENKLNYDWASLRKDILEFGLRHSTLSAQMPSESSSVVSNATNGIEPPRGYLSVKKSKKGPLKQIVPQYQSLKNNYTLLWDMPSNEGYINVVAVMQKFFDQAISGNWSYNPTHFPDNEVPMSVMIGDLLNTYKYGWKTSYYQNTYDYKEDPSDMDEPAHSIGWRDDQPEVQPATLATDEDDEFCDACAI
jgi:ribonucleoside-diphosphate reductase alpha chain